MSAVLDNRGLPATAEPSAVAALSARPLVLRSNAVMDALFRNLTRFFAFAVFGLLAAILVSLAVGSAPALRKFGLGFLGTVTWDPVQQEFGALVPIYGTLVTSAIALVVAVPVSFGI